MEPANEVKPEVNANPQLTEEEILRIRIMQNLRKKLIMREEFAAFNRIQVKPPKESKPLKLDESGKVIEWEGKPAPISSGNPTKGTMRNKPCSCGAKNAHGKPVKYKNCCLKKKYNS